MPIDQTMLNSLMRRINVLESEVESMRRNRHIQSGSSDPVFTAAEEGRLFYNTTAAKLKINDGSAWVALH